MVILHAVRPKQVNCLKQRNTQGSEVQLVFVLNLISEDFAPVVGANQSRVTFDIQLIVTLFI